GRAARRALLPPSVSPDGSVLSLAVDPAVLASPETHYPVYIDPSFEWQTADGKRMHYNEVQEACPTASHYDTRDNTDYWSLGVGYDDWPGGDCNGRAGHANALYQIAIPHAIWDAHVHAATVNMQEAYTSSCSASANMTLALTRTMNSNTDWNHRPAVAAEAATRNVGPAPRSCNTTFDKNPSAWTGVGFDVLGTVRKAADGHWGNITLRLWMPGDNNDVHFKRFGHDPYLQVLYNTNPRVPS